MIILASNSQLRKMIMEASELPFEVLTEDVDERLLESQNKDKTVGEIVQLLATAKARAVADAHPDRAVIAADTFGVLPDGTRLHKGKNIEESIQMAMLQSGVTVLVYTGTAVAYKEKTLTLLTTTKITYSSFDEKVLRHLYSTNDAAKRRNAALGFFIDAPGFTLVEKIEGSYLSAMGLPMGEVRKALNELGYTRNPYGY